MQPARGLAALLFTLVPGCLLPGLCAQAFAQPTLLLHYQERAPYATTQPDGSVTGLVADPAARALARAEVAFVWVRTPSQRQLALIQQGQGLHCGLGWFRNAERAALGKFSQPLFRDAPLGALARDDSALHAGMRFADALALAGQALLVKEGYSYGPEVDRALAARSPPVPSTSADAAPMLRMLLGGRAAWMLATPEEAQALRAQAGAAAARLRVLHFADIAAGQPRHLYCSRALPDAWLERIDQALAR